MTDTAARADVLRDAPSSRGDRIRRFRQCWNEAELIDGLGLLPG